MGMLTTIHFFIMRHYGFTGRYEGKAFRIDAILIFLQSVIKNIKRRNFVLVRSQTKSIIKLLTRWEI